MEYDSYNIFLHIDEICKTAVGDYKSTASILPNELPNKIENIRIRNEDDSDDISTARENIASSIAAIFEFYELSRFFYPSLTDIPSHFDSLVNEIHKILRTNSMNSRLLSSKTNQEAILEIQIAKLQHSNSEANQLILSLNTEIGALKSSHEIDLSRHSIKNTNLLKKFQEDKSELENRLHESELVHDKVLGELTVLTNKLHDNTQDFDDLNQRHGDLIITQNQDRNTILNLEDLISTLKRDFADGKLISSENELIDCKQAMLTMTIEIEDLKAQLAESLKDKVPLVETYDTNKVELITDKSRLEIDELNFKYQLLADANADNIKALEIAHKNYSATENAHTLKMQECELQHDDLFKQVEEKNRLVSSIRDSFESQSLDIDIERKTFKREADNLRLDISKLQTATELLHGAASESQESLHSKNTEITDLKHQLKSLKESNIHFKGLVHSREEKISELNDAIAKFMEVTKGGLVVGDYSNTSSATKPGMITKSSSTSVAAVVAGAAARLSPSANSDRIFVMSDVMMDQGDNNIVFIECGSYFTRLGLWNHDLKVFKLMYECPTILATCSKRKRENLLKSASVYAYSADSIYQEFRENGMVVGANADYCLFNHPDPGLRGSLASEEIISSANGKVLNKTGFGLLLRHLLTKGLGCSDAADLQILFAYKLTFEASDLQALAESLFETICCSKVCVVTEASLIASSGAFPFEDTKGLSPMTTRAVISSSKTLLNELHSACALVIDIGAHITTIFPVYEGMVIRSLVSMSNIGGELCTEYMEQMLNNGKIANFGEQLSRRRQKIAREVKERSVFIATDFEASKELYGTIEFEAVKVMHVDSLDEETGRDDLMAIAQANKTSMVTENTADVAVTIEIKLSDGIDVPVTVDRERYYCGEVLFTPTLLGKEYTQLGLIDAIVLTISNIDDSVRSDICSKMVLSGKTSLLPGLPERLHRELANRVKDLGVDSFSIALKEEPNCSAVWQGANGRMEYLSEAPFETQNFVTFSDYADMGPSLLSDILIG